MEPGLETNRDPSVRPVIEPYRRPTRRTISEKTPIALRGLRLACVLDQRRALPRAFVRSSNRKRGILDRVFNDLRNILQKSNFDVVLGLSF